MKSLLKQFVSFSVAISMGVAAICAYAADSAPGIVGKDDWLFYRYEFSDAADQSATDKSIALIAKLNREMVRNGVNMAVTMVPLKARIYAEHLPADMKLNSYMSGNYQRMMHDLRAANVKVLDLNTAFIESVAKKPDDQLFFRLDTHWAPSGAMLAAETIKQQISKDNDLKKILDSIPTSHYKIVWRNKPVKTQSRDLVGQLPAGAASYAPEMTRLFSISTVEQENESLLDEDKAPQITLMGSSYSHSWTGFADALRYTLQHDLLDVSVGADRGSWTGLESYLRDDAFQTQRPKLIIWEMPERDMRAPPDYHYRDARYVTDNTEWLLRASAWVEKDCKLSSNGVHMINGGLIKNAGANLKTAATVAQDYLDLSFDQQLQQLDYLSMNIKNSGEKVLRLEAGEGDNKRIFNVPLAGDDMSHLIKIPLTSKGVGYSKVRIYPGINSSLSLSELKVCSLPADLLH